MFDPGTVERFDAATGNSLGTFVPNIGTPFDLAFHTPFPEPASAAAAALAVAALWARTGRRCRRSPRPI